MIVGKAPMESWVSPPGRTRRGATAPAPGSWAPASSSRSSAPGRTAMSLLAGAIHSESVRSAIRLTAGPKPMLSSASIRFTHGKRCRTMSGEPSSDALSITHTSATPASASGANDSRQLASRSRVFHETIATVIGAVAKPARDSTRGRAARRPLRRPRRSPAAKAQASAPRSRGHARRRPPPPASARTRVVSAANRRRAWATVARSMGSVHVKRTGRPARRRQRSAAAASCTVKACAASYSPRTRSSAACGTPDRPGMNPRRSRTISTGRSVRAAIRVASCPAARSASASSFE